MFEKFFKSKKEKCSSQYLFKQLLDKSSNTKVKSPYSPDKALEDQRSYSVKNNLGLSNNLKRDIKIQSQISQLKIQTQGKSKCLNQIRISKQFGRLIKNNKKEEAIEYFLRHPNIDVNYPIGEKLDTALHFACACNAIELLELILDSGCYIDVKNSN